MAGSKINLTFINKSADTNQSEIVVFQKNSADKFGEIAVAWKVIKNCGQTDNHPFTYPMGFDISTADSYGNHTPYITAYDGQSYELIKDNSGDILQLSTEQASSANEVEIRNNLTTGAINANIYRDGNLLATTTGISPGEKASFQFHPIIYIGIAENLVEGEVISPAIADQVNTEINLLGIQNADIVMTGGGSGPTASPFKFTLENINK